MGIGRILPGVASLNGRIFVVGGEQDSQILANGECYDPSDNAWTKVCTNNASCKLWVVFSTSLFLLSSPSEV